MLHFLHPPGVSENVDGNKRVTDELWMVIPMGCAANEGKDFDEKNRENVEIFTLFPT